MYYTFGYLLLMRLQFQSKITLFYKKLMLKREDNLLLKIIDGAVPGVESDQVAMTFTRSSCLKLWTLIIDKVVRLYDR